MKKQKTRVYIVDDHQMFIDGLQALLTTRDDIEITGTNLSAVDALKVLKKTPVDILITDINMPEMNGVELTRLLKMHRPETMVLCLSMHKDMTFIDQMMEAGANAYLLKNTGIKELFLAIDTILKGDVFYSDAVKDTIVNRYRESATGRAKPERSNDLQDVILTRREKEIIKYIAKGLSSADIAEILRLSYYTITTHRKNIHTKLNINKASDLVEYARKNNLTDS